MNQVIPQSATGYRPSLYSTHLAKQENPPKMNLTKLLEAAGQLLSHTLWQFSVKFVQDQRANGSSQTRIKMQNRHLLAFGSRPKHAYTNETERNR